MPQDGTGTARVTSPLPNVPKPGQEAGKIRSMFDSIAYRYDLLNHLLSGGIDITWRKYVTRQVLTGREERILDLACGTGDLALEMRGKAGLACQVFGVDFSGEMLRLAHDKSTDDPKRHAITWIHGDGLRLPFPDESFDLVTIAFGIRNMESLDAALKEIRRVLRPGGRLAILEFTQPDNWLVRTIYMPYFIHVLPRIGAILSRRSAYLYLAHSVIHFPNRWKLAEIMRKSGYRKVRHCPLTFGIAALHIGERKEVTS